MDDDFDEFGNYIGEEYSDSEEAEVAVDQWELDQESDNEDGVQREYFHHDTQDISEPLFKIDKSTEQSSFQPNNWELHSGIIRGAKGLVRNIAVVGDVNHGKTSLIQFLLEGSDSQYSIDDAPTPIEAQRHLTMSCSFMSFLVQDSRCKSHVFNMVDTPGHPDFLAESSAILTGCEGVMHVVDVLEGPISSRHSSTLPTVVVFNRMDGLVLDHRLPPVEAFRRIKTLADEMSVGLDKIIYASAKFRFAFSLSSVLRLYAKYYSVDSFNLDLSTEVNFVDYVLQPLYKLISCGLIGPKSETLIKSLGIELTTQQWESSYDTRIRYILDLYFETGSTPLVDALLETLPAPSPSAELESEEETACRDLTHFYQDSMLYTVGRVVRGTLYPDTGNLWFPLGNRKLSVKQVSSGSFYMKASSATAGPISKDLADPPKHSVVRVGIEARDSKLETDRKLRDTMHMLCAVHPALRYAPSENGIHYLFGPGELYLDMCMGELKSRSLNISTSQPTAELHETVSSESYIELPVSSQDSSISVVASPCKEAIEENQNLWAVTEERCFLIGPSPKSQNDDALVSGIVEGFRWFAERGPLIDGTVRDSVFKVTRIQTEGHPGPQLSANMHHACNAAMLVASPRLVEPWCRVAVIGGLAAGKACYSELGKRGGSVVRDMPIVGTNMYRTDGLVPVMDSFGLQVDIQCQLASGNDSKVILEFDGWREVPGDPLDTSIKVPRLRPAAEEARARDFMVKTRRLKGLAAEPVLAKYIDDKISKLVD